MPRGPQARIFDNDLTAAQRLNKIFRSRHFRGLARGGLLLLAVHGVGTLGYHAIGSPIVVWVDMPLELDVEPPDVLEQATSHLSID